MQIKDAVIRLENAQVRYDADNASVLNLAIKALKQSGADYIDVSTHMKELLENESRSNDSPDKWAEDVYIAALAMKRHLECKKYFEQNRKVIDGETQSAWASIILAILGFVVTVIVAILYFLGCINEIDFDLFSYIIMFVGDVVVILLAGIVRIFNKHQTQKHDKNYEYTVAELMAAKYEDSPKIVKVLLSSEIRRPLIYAGRDLSIGKLDFTGNAPAEKTPDIGAERDINIGEIKL